MLHAPTSGKTKTSARPATSLGSLDLLGGDAPADRGVGLELAVDHEIGPLCLGQLHRRADTVYGGAGAAAAGRVGQHARSALPGP